MNYELDVCFRPALRGTLIVEAASEDEARQAVSDLTPEELMAKCSQLDVASLQVYEVRLIT